MSPILARRRTALRLGSVVLAVSLAAGACTYETRDLQVSLPVTAQSSFIYDAQGRLITAFRGEQHRRNLESLDDVPRILQDAVVAIEDERFWQHQGVDVRALLRAARSNVAVDGVFQGGSTITQQYVGRAFLDRTEITASRKIEEIALALQLERAYTKEFILLQYLNTVNFGEGAYGVLTAAREYFDKELDELTLGEAALLAGLIQAPSARNPYENRESAIQRREAVLERMLANNWITEKEFDQARTEPLHLAPRVATLEEEYEYGYFVEEVRQWILTDPRFGSTPDERVRLLFEGGLHIYTTLRPEVQHSAEAALTAILPWEGGPSAAIVVIRNDTGHVEAMVGGRDFFGEAGSARFNLATQGGPPSGIGIQAVRAGRRPRAGHPDERPVPGPVRDRTPNTRTRGDLGGEQLLQHRRRASDPARGPGAVHQHGVRPAHGRRDPGGRRRHGAAPGGCVTVAAGAGRRARKRGRDRPRHGRCVLHARAAGHLRAPDDGHAGHPTGRHGAVPA